MTHPWNIETTTYSDIKDLRYEVALLPVGATEPHGMHLPYGEDAFCVTEVSDRSCQLANERGARTIRLPTIPYGVDTNQLAFPLALNVHQKTLNRIIVDIADSLVRHGVRKLVIVNGHGGNEFKSFLREQFGRNDFFICLVNWWTMGEDRYKDIFTNRDDHAGEMETSVGLHLFPRLIHLDRAGDGSTRQTDFEAMNRGWVQFTRPWHLFTKDSSSGDPRQATADKGRRYLELAVERFASFLVELSCARIDEHFPYSKAFPK